MAAQPTNHSLPEELKSLNWQMIEIKGTRYCATIKVARAKELLNGISDGYQLTEHENAEYLCAKPALFERMKKDGIILTDMERENPLEGLVL